MNTEAQTTKASDTQVGGSHYKDMGQFQPWDVLAHWLTPDEYRGYQKGVAIAYLARERSKGGDQDIRKAVHHLQRLVEELDAAEEEHVVYALEGDAARHDDVQACCGNHATCTNPCVHRWHAQGDEDGWIEWAGGECPVPAGTEVEAQWRDGTIYIGRACVDQGLRNANWMFRHSDIVRFRIDTP